MIRVNHAGELGAQTIYEGQMRVFKGTPLESTIQEMSDQEKKHLQWFEDLLSERRVRPTVLNPIWGVVGHAIGAGSALLGKEPAMALTVAVEEVISEHYKEQLRELDKFEYSISEEDIQLKKFVQEAHDDEMEHRDIGLHHGAEQTPLYSAFTGAIKAGTRAAIWLSSRV
eukprot:TRINITY_DN7480_c0_g1_i1.p1 TRINITY_DN7480_c0_g1~~TRINITY_DN7480_c0_g1_i1.p1  ORF type:complete len:170 (+),score=55.07 TRINITY_DN7480_c0_g1_i1:93-602(+)